MAARTNTFKPVPHFLRWCAALGATRRYIEENDIVANFLSECCEKIVNNEIKSSELYARYKQYCSANSHRYMSGRLFSANLSEKGYECKENCGIYWLDLKLNNTSNFDV